MSEILDFIFELFFELYLELMFLIVPEEERTKKHGIIATLLAIIVLIAVFALIIWGAILIADFDNILGLIPIIAAVIISLVQIIAGIVLYIKKH